MEANPGHTTFTPVSRPSSPSGNEFKITLQAIKKTISVAAVLFSL